MLKNFAKRIIYDPVGARVLYDFILATSSNIVIFLIFKLFQQPTLSIKELLTLPSVYIAMNYIFGVYGRHKMSPVWIKALILFLSGLATLEVFIVLNLFSLPLLLSLLFITVCATMPRAFLNFSTTSFKYKNLSPIILTKSPILVVGGGGYIGTHVVEKLLKENYKVRVFDKFLYSKDVFVGMEKSHNLEIIEGDISDLYKLTLALGNTQALIHLAGIVGDPASAIDEKLTRHMNIVTTRMLRETAKAFRIPKFIFASSCSVYGASSKIVNENSSLNPISLYAKTKIDAEQELLHDTFDEFHPTILRFATAFGHSRKPRFDLVANLFVAQAMNNETIAIDNKKAWRPFIHVSDAANAIVETIKAQQNKVSRQIFNVGDDNLNYRIIDIAKQIKKILKKEKKVNIEVTKTNQDPRNYKVSFKKIKNILGFQTKIGMEEGISEIVDHIKKGSYGRSYTNPFYSNLEITKEILKEFYSKDYRKTHFSTLS